MPQYIRKLIIKNEGESYNKYEQRVNAELSKLENVPFTDSNLSTNWLDESGDMFTIICYTKKEENNKEKRVGFVK